MKIELLPCDCGSDVEVVIASGGTRYEATMYDVNCTKCGTVIEDAVPSNCSGRKRDAELEWNRIQKSKRPTTTKGKR